MYTILLHFVLLLQPGEPVRQQHLLKGRWGSQEDSRSRVEFHDRAYYRIYDKDTTAKGTYTWSHQSCDTSYYKGPDRKLEFIRLDDGSYYEITALTKQNLSYRYTVNG
ncbi:hypothetical protein ACQKLP_17835 [Chitinophaga sp. NPDC101104]|uniref:hypothetical protein n=1 Tax=Chitinophaga sp. NPDC101104 TaxID=3390561 RepID=UPI003D05AEEB